MFSRLLEPVPGLPLLTQILLAMAASKLSVVLLEKSLQSSFCLFSWFFTENNLGKRLIKGIVSRKLEYLHRTVLETPNFYNKRPVASKTPMLM